MKTTTNSMTRLWMVALLFMACVFTTAAADFMVDSICYNIIGDNEVEVTKRDSVKYSGEVFIPATVVHDGVTYQVTRIGTYAFQSCNDLTVVDIPEGIVTIDKWAFSYCRNLQNVELPNSLVSIELFSFYGCTGFTSFHVPRNLSYIAYNALLSCTNIDYYSCSSLSPYFKAVNGVLYSKDLTTLVAYPSAATATSFDIPTTVTKLHDYCFSSCNNLTSINIPETVTLMGMNVFRDCKGFTEIDIPDGVTHMGVTTFGGCTNLARVHLPASLDSIMNSTFTGCYALTEITVPRNVTCIDEQGFLDARNLKTVIFEEGSRLTSIGKNAFCDCFSLETFDMPNTVTFVGHGCFSDCHALKEVHMSENLTEIGTAIFWECNELTECEIIAEVPTMKNICVFCPKLKRVKLGDKNSTPGVTLLQNSTLSMCEQLEILELGANIDSLENSALNSLDSLKVLISWAAIPPRCNDYWSAFWPWPANMKSTILYVPKASFEAYSTAYNWKDFKTMVAIEDVGDVNRNGNIDVGDVAKLINMLLTGEIERAYADVNLDGAVTVGDVAALINKLLSAE